MKGIGKTKVGVCALLLAVMMGLVVGACAESTTCLSADIISQFGIPIDGWYSTDDSAAQFAFLTIVECNSYYSEEMARVLADSLRYQTMYLGVKRGQLTLCAFGEEHFFMFMYDEDGEAGFEIIPYRNAYQVSEDTMDYLVEHNGIETYRQIDRKRLLDLLDISIEGM